MPNEKKRIIRRVYRKLSDPNTGSVPTDYITKASMYTGLHPKTLMELENSAEFKTNTECVDRTLIYNTLCRFYVRFRSDGGKLPTTYELFDALNKMNKLTHMDIGSFRKLLLKMDFIWKKIKSRNSLETGGVVVMEKPLVRLQRFNYLMHIRKSRIEKYDDILFVDEVAYNHGMFMDIKTSRDFEKVTNGGWQQRVIYAVGVKSVVCFKEIKEFDESEFENWILTNLCPTLAQPSVIVVHDFHHHNAMLHETPTLYSSTTDTMDWLDYHDVPYDTEMSKYELYSLAEEYTDLETPLYKIDGILKARGHTLLRLPKCINELSPAALLFSLIEKNWTDQDGHCSKTMQVSGQDIKAVANSCFWDMMMNSMRFLEGYTSSVIYNEQKMIALEKDVDRVLDKLMIESGDSSAMGSEKDDSDVASWDDSE